MKNFLCVLIFVSLCTVSMVAQDTISISYQSPKDVFMQKLMDFQGIFGFDVIVRTSHKNLPYKLHMVRCTDGKTEKKALNEEIPCEMDSVQHFYFFAQAESTDSVHIDCQHRVGTILHIPIATKNCILMETLPVKTYTSADRIPLMAYTTGHRYEMNFNGQKVEAIDYCGVRYSKTHPSEWYEKFNIQDYIYFELEFQPK